MTSRSGIERGRSTDELGNLIRWTLYDSVGQVQPPACVWMNIRRRLRRRAVSRTKQYVRRGDLYWPAGAFGVRERSFPLPLACIIEQQMPVLRGIGWAT